jgi:hypothetical protein
MAGEGCVCEIEVGRQKSLCPFDIVVIVEVLVVVM